MSKGPIKKISSVLAFTFFLIFLLNTRSFGVQTGGAGYSNPELIRGELTTESFVRTVSLEVSSGITKFGTQTYSWPTNPPASNTFLKIGNSGVLTWESVSGTVPDPTAAGDLLIGTSSGGSWASKSVSGDVTIDATGLITINDAKITSAKIADDAITQSKLADNSVGTNEIINGAVSADKIADDAITQSKLADNSVGTNEIINGAITSTKLASNIDITTTGSISASTVAADNIYGVDLSKSVKGILDVPFGGTGKTIFPTGEVVYGNGTSSLETSSYLNFVSGTGTSKGLMVGPVSSFLSIDNNALAVIDDQNTFSTISSVKFGDTNTIPAYTTLKFGGSISAPQAVTNDSVIGVISFSGFDGNEIWDSAGMISKTTEDWSGTNHGGKLVLSSTNKGGAGYTRITLDNGNILTEGNIVSSGTLEVQGQVIYTPSSVIPIGTPGITKTHEIQRVLLIKGDLNNDTEETNNIDAGENGQILTLIGMSDTDLIKFNPGGNIQLSGNVSFTLGAGDILQVIYSSALGRWVEINRSDN